MYKLSNYNIIKEYDDDILIYNSYTKASLFLEKNSNIDVFNNIKYFDKLDDETKKILINNGFVIDEKRDELKELEYMFTKVYFNNDFLNVVLVPSLGCNFKCPYCFEKGQTNFKENVREYFKILKKYGKKYFKEYKVIQFSLFGGEPLVYYNDVKKFLDWVKKDSKVNNYKYITSIVTNGSLLTEKITKELIDHNMFSLQITLDSDKKTHDSLRIYKNDKPSFDILINKIKMLLDVTKKEKDFIFNLRINLLNCDTMNLKETLLRFEPKYRSRINLLIRAVYKTSEFKGDNNNNVSDLRKFYDIALSMGYKIVKNTYHYQSCEGCADTKFFYLLPDLSMWKCVNDLNYKEACFGYINSNGDPFIDERKTTNWYHNASNCFSLKECRECKLLPDCLGGCILHSCKNCKKNCKTFDMACLPYIMQ